ncbi:MAG: putative mechanosensitive channel protein [Labilithrix sp.]|nr:putative mechanosensitive channel protein [Labilithrix sp.]
MRILRTLLAALAPIAALALLLLPRLALAAPASATIDDDLTTPRRALTSFLDACHREDWERAMRVLDVAANANPARKLAATEQAKQLDFLLTRALWVDLDAVSDEMAGSPGDGPDTEHIVTAQLAGHDVPLTMRLVKGSPQRWVFSNATLARVPELYVQHGPTLIEQRMPEALRVPVLGMAAWQWVGLGIAIFLGIVLGRGIAFLVSWFFGRIARRTQVQWDDDLVDALRSPMRLFFTLSVFRVLGKLLAMPTGVRGVVVAIAGSLFVITLAWMIVRIADVVAQSLERRATRDSIDLEEAVLKARGVRTQARVLKRVVHMAVVCLAAALILMQFEVVRSIGVSLLASAGVAGIVLGLAAQRTIGSVVAGIQLAITQPIRIGDVVVVENESGTIEEITLTYVVVKVWDERRLVVPMARFFEQPFQNWTKSSAQLTGTVFVYADYTLPLELVRKQVDAILVGHPLWDTREKAVHLTEAMDHVIEVRVVVSASDSSRLFDLRADVREKLVTWLQALDDGRHLPRLRGDADAALRARLAGAPARV